MSNYQKIIEIVNDATESKVEEALNRYKSGSVSVQSFLFDIVQISAEVDAVLAALRSADCVLPPR